MKIESVRALLTTSLLNLSTITAETPRDTLTEDEWNRMSHVYDAMYVLRQMITDRHDAANEDAVNEETEMMKFYLNPEA